MQLTAGSIYHVYNRGNNRERIFFASEDYRLFLKNMRIYLKPHADILAWCLMPSHFHFLIHANETSVQITEETGFKRQQFSQSMRQLLSSYTHTVSSQEGRTVGLFLQRTKAVCVSDDREHAAIAFRYIHQGPVRTRLVEKLEDWAFSSFADYAGNRDGKLCDRLLATRLLNLQEESVPV